MNVFGGRQRSALTLDSCQSECIADLACTGLDWVPSSSIKCWIHGSWSSGNTRNSYVGVDHYDLNRDTNCTGKSHAPRGLTTVVKFGDERVRFGRPFPSLLQVIFRFFIVATSVNVFFCVSVPTVPAHHGG